MSPGSGWMPATLAVAMTSVGRPAAELGVQVVEVVLEVGCRADRRTMKARNVPTVAMIQKVFCQRNVVRSAGDQDRAHQQRP